MNDNIIINIISKTYFNIVSFFVLIFWLLLIAFIILQNGLFLNNISLSNVHIEQLYIKWNNKIDISAKEILIEKTEESTNKFEYANINKYFKILSHSKTWFNSLVIDKISYDNINASFKYEDGKNGFFDVKSNDFSLSSSISLLNDTLYISVDKLTDKKRKLNASGDLYFDTKELAAYSNINLKIADDADVNLYSKTTTEKLSYKLTSNKEIKNIKHLVDIAHLPKEVRYWAYDAIDMSYVNLTSAYGFIDFNDIKNAVKNIYIKALVNKVNYTYNKNLDAIHAKSVELEFKQGIFYIRPVKAYSYGMYLNKSWIKVDFTKKEELLTLNLLFDGILNRDILKILDTYKIKLPFLQKSGKVSTDLKIFVGLRTIDVEAKGNFYTKEANFDYIGLNVDIYDARIKLDNYDVTIKNMKAAYQKMAKATVDVNYNAKSAEGQVKFLFSSINLLGASLQTKSEPLKAIYNISPNNDSITAENSLWDYKGKTVTIDSLSMPFDLNKLQVNIPATIINVKDIGSSFVSGNINLSDMSTNLNLDILKLNYDGIELSQSNTPIKVTYNKKISIFSENTIHFTVSGSKYKAKRLYIDIDKEQIKLKHTSIEIGKYITAKVYASYNTQTKKSHISLTKFVLTDPNTKKIIYKKSKIILAGKLTNKSIHITSKELDANFTSQDTGWRLKLNSIGRVSNNSELLKRFQVTKGYFTLYKNSKDKYTRFKSEVIYPYKILVKNNIPVDKYLIKGKIYKEKVYIDINNNVHIDIKDTINVNLKKSVVNLPETLSAVKEMSTTTDSNSTLDVILKANNSHFYVNENRKILYNSVHMQYYNKILTAQLKHEIGDAGLRLKDNMFHLYGKDFNDKFMNQLFALSNFSKGDLSFSMNGELDDYLGSIYIKGTTIKDAKTLNNILAFVNTIPSLITFNVPGYSRDGLYVKQAYLNFKSEENKFDLTDIYLDSKEIDILGNGKLDIDQNNLDLTLNLKTDLGSDLAKVPLVGHIILGKDSISTTLKITGEIADPKVESLIAQEIVVAPINIIKRTLSLPYNLIEDVINKSKEDNSSSNK